MEPNGSHVLYLLKDADQKYWEAHPHITNYIASQIRPDDLVLELGPGQSPFHRADKFVDWIVPDNIPSHRIVACDMNKDRLPFDDKSFDFAYCRHLLEDMYNPFLLCTEMMRVAKAGYIETPSPMSELCRGIDARSPLWRGYVHHRYIVWENDGVLNFIAKYPLVDFLKLQIEAPIVGILKEGPKYWNTCFRWNDKFSIEHHQHDVNYSLQADYETILVEAVKQSTKSINRFVDGMRRHIAS